MKTEEFEYTFEDKEFKCPYCGEDQSDSWEIAEEEDSVIIECDCGKKYYGGLVVIRRYKGKANCELNNEEHDWEGLGADYLKCSKCGKIQCR